MRYRNSENGYRTQQDNYVCPRRPSQSVHYAPEPSLSISVPAEFLTRSIRRRQVSCLVHKYKHSRTEIWMSLRLSCSQAFLVVIPKEFVQEVNCLICDVTLVLRRDKSGPRFARVAGERVNHPCTRGLIGPLTVQGFHRTARLIRCHTFQCTHKVHLSRELWRS